MWSSNRQGFLCPFPVPCKPQIKVSVSFAIIYYVAIFIMIAMMAPMVCEDTATGLESHIHVYYIQKTRAGLAQSETFGQISNQYAKQKLCYFLHINKTFTTTHVRPPTEQWQKYKSKYRLNKFETHLETFPLYLRRIAPSYCTFAIYFTKIICTYIYSYLRT